MSSSSTLRERAGAPAGSAAGLRAGPTGPSPGPDGVRQHPTLIAITVGLSVLEAGILVLVAPHSSWGLAPQVVAPAELIRRVTSHHAIRDLFVENPPIETIVARLYAAHEGPA